MGWWFPVDSLLLGLSWSIISVARLSSPQLQLDKLDIAPPYPADVPGRPAAYGFSWRQPLQRTSLRRTGDHGMGMGQNLLYILYIYTVSYFGYIKTYQKTIIFGRRNRHSPFEIGYHPAIRVLLPFGPLGPDLHWGWCLLQSISRRHRTQESGAGRETRTGWFLPVVPCFRAMNGPWKMDEKLVIWQLPMGEVIS